MVKRVFKFSIHSFTCVGWASALTLLHAYGPPSISPLAAVAVYQTVGTPKIKRHTPIRSKVKYTFSAQQSYHLTFCIATIVKIVTNGNVNIPMLFVCRMIRPYVRLGPKIE